jgi:hypothetical protein
VIDVHGGDRATRGARQYQQGQAIGAPGDRARDRRARWRKRAASEKRDGQIRRRQ